MGTMKKSAWSRKQTIRIFIPFFVICFVVFFDVVGLNLSQILLMIDNLIKSQLFRKTTNLQNSFIESELGIHLHLKQTELSELGNRLHLKEPELALYYDHSSSSVGHTVLAEFLLKE